MEVPDEYAWFVAEDWFSSLREAVLERHDEFGTWGADAVYFRNRLALHNVHDAIQWERLQTTSGKISIFVRREVLKSEDHTLYVFSHELHELRELRSEFEGRGGSMLVRAFAELIEPRLGGPIHTEAVRFADELVRRFRVERGFMP